MIPNINLKVICPPEEVCNKLRFGLWFDRQDPLSFKSVPELEQYATGQHWISVKQAPCATSLKNPGSASLMSKLDIVRSVGFPIELTNEESNLKLGAIPDSTLHQYIDEEVSSEGVIEVENPSDPELLKILTGQEPTPPEEYLEGEWERPKKTKRQPRLLYEDPWKIFAGRVLSSVRQNIAPPELMVWYGDNLRIQDPIPARLLGPTFKAGMRTKKKMHPIRFQDIKSFESQMYLIKFHTHWGHRLWNMARGDDISSNWAKTLKKRIKALLSGKPDPLWTKVQLERYYSKPGDIRSRSRRALRFIELIKTTDGMFVQRYLAFPEEVWSWEKYDLYFLRNISYLISDEFFDGELTKEALDVPTFYSSLKNSRKSFKGLFYSDYAFKTDLMRESLDGWLLNQLPVWKRVQKMEYSPYKVFVMGILSQSRGCGTPPLIVTLLSKRKFVETVTTPVEPLNVYNEGLIRACMKHIVSNLPDEAFTGLDTKARITLTTSACFEETVKEGGTVQAIANMLQRIPTGTLIPIRNLETGTIDERVEKDTLTIGELIFWHSVQKVVETPLEELRTVFLLIVKEPGKARSVTKSLSYLKVVLDVISKICSYPLKKGISSSESGMSMESHGWNFFKRFFKPSSEVDLFLLKERDVGPFVGGSRNVTETYNDVFVSSTDYETATDYMDHSVVRIISETWMKRCGIPKFLRGIVHNVCYKPRKILFRAEGPLSDLGSPTNTEGVRCVTTSRGVLMGDPLTKPCLHLINVAVRVLAENCTNVEFLSEVSTNPFELARHFRTVVGRDLP
jgi:hypothetical protein